MYFLQWQDDVLRHGSRVVNRVAQENGWFVSPIFLGGCRYCGFGCSCMRCSCLAVRE